MRYQHDSCGRVVAKILMKQMGADDLWRRQLEKQLCLNLSATHFYHHYLGIMSLVYYIRLNTPSTAISAWEHLIQYVRNDLLPPP